MSDLLSTESIVVRGARVHNLRNIDFEVVHNTLTVVTGVSGSGKSSLAFDTIYAEGQRRYVESLSAYARQFLERIEKPDVDSIDGIAPAVAIRQKNTTRNPRSTGATATEIYDYLRLLYARVGRTYCANGGHEVKKDTLDEVADAILALPPNDAEPARQRRFAQRFECKYCSLSYEEPEPRLFSFNNPYGACPRCQGFGNTIDFDLDLVIPQKTKTLAEGAIEPWTKPKYRPLFTELKRFAKKAEIPLDVPWIELEDEQRQLILHCPRKFL